MAQEASGTFPHNGYQFGVCLTHDIDRPYKGIQAPYYALRDRSFHHLRALDPRFNPWWQFDTLRELESELDVRSALYFLRERRLLERPRQQWVSPVAWVESLGRYNPDRPRISEVIRRFDDEGWEIGLHGSIASASNDDRLRFEKTTLEDLLGHHVLGGRQHHLRLERPRTWKRHQEAGLRYDSSLGSARRVGFHHGYDLLRPFEDEFVVFPLTVMDIALERATDDVEEAWDRLEGLLEEAAENGAVMTVCWHLRNFSDADFPGHLRLYRRLVERAKHMGGWVGPPGELYASLHPERAESTLSGSL